MSKDVMSSNVDPKKREFSSFLWLVFDHWCAIENCWNRCLFVWEGLKRISKIQHNGIDYIIDYTISVDHIFECPYFPIGFSKRHRCRSSTTDSILLSRLNILSLSLALAIFCLSRWNIHLQQSVFNLKQSSVLFVLC